MTKQIRLQISRAALQNAMITQQKYEQKRRTRLTGLRCKLKQERRRATPPHRKAALLQNPTLIEAVVSTTVGPNIPQPLQPPASAGVVVLLAVGKCRGKLAAFNSAGVIDLTHTLDDGRSMMMTTQYRFDDDGPVRLLLKWL